MSDNQIPTPVFILGCQRSGTSLLRRILDSHSNIACPPESGFIVQLARVYEVQRSLENLNSLGFSAEEVLEQMKKFTSYFFDEYAKKKGKGRWMDKTPHYLNHVDTIDKMFAENVKYIGIVRHALDVADSLSNFDWGILKPYISEGIDKRISAVRFWKDQNKKLIDFRNKIGDRFYLIKYEDLTKYPKEILLPLLQFIDEPWEEGILNYSKFEHDPGFEDPKILDYEKIKFNSGNYKLWPHDLQKMAYSEVDELLQHFGYKI